VPNLHEIFMKKIFLFLITKFFISFNYVFAQNPTDSTTFPVFFRESLTSTTAIPQKKYETQISILLKFLKQNNNSLFTGVNLEYGFSKKLQFQLFVPYSWQFSQNIETTKGFLKPQVGMLYNFSNRKNFVFSLKTEAQLPITSDLIEDENPEFQAKFLFAYSLFPKFQIHSGIGVYNFLTEKKFLYHLSISYSIKNFVPSFEWKHFAKIDKNFLIFGIIYRKNLNFETGIAFFSTNTDFLKTYGTIFKFTFNFSVEEKD